MTIRRVVELLKIEHECMLRNSHGDCNRQCEDCDLVQDDEELHEMYTGVIGVLKAQEPVKPEMIMYTGAGIGISNCPQCGCKIDEYHNDKFCGSCGQAVKWE